MADWVEDQTTHPFSAAKSRETSLVHVSGVMDKNGDNRSKLILEDHPDSKGASIHEPQARDACIQSLASEMKIEPQKADWFVRRQNGTLQQVSYSDKKVAQENPQFTDLRRSQDMHPHELPEAKKAFPDIHAHSSVSPIKPEQQKELNEAFRQAKENKAEKSSGAEQTPANEKQEKATKQEKAAHEYDLSKERIRGR